jgi:hypothetical protein
LGDERRFHTAWTHVGHAPLSFGRAEHFAASAARSAPRIQ